MFASPFPGAMYSSCLLQLFTESSGITYLGFGFMCPSASTAIVIPDADTGQAPLTCQY